MAATIATTTPGLSAGPASVDAQGSHRRVYDIAHDDGRVDLDFISRFISAYQTITSLKLGELWAMPIMCCCLAVIENIRRIALPTMYLITADPECGLDYVANRTRENFFARTMLTYSFALGGTNAVLVLAAARCANVAVAVPAKYQVNSAVPAQNPDVRSAA